MTACTPSDRILQTLQVHTPGATVDLINLELFNTIDEFFRRTSAWRFQNNINMVADVFEYSFGTPADTVVVRVLGVSHNLTPVPTTQSIAGGGSLQTSVGQLDPYLRFADGDSSFDPDRIDLNPGNNLFSYAVYRPGYISLSGLPDAEARKYPMNVWLALSLTPGCLECSCGDWMLEDWMWDSFFHDWVDGTLGRLYAMPAKPWASITHAQYHGKRFRNAMAMRKQEATRGFVYNSPSWRYPRWTI